MQYSSMFVSGAPINNMLSLICGLHYGDVKWPSWRHDIMASRRLELPVNPVFVQQFVQTNNKETPKSALLSFCVGNPPVIGGFPTQRVSYAENGSFDDVMIWRRIDHYRNIDEDDMWHYETSVCRNEKVTYWATIVSFPVNIPNVSTTSLIAGFMGPK